MIVAILLTFVLFSAASVAVSVSVTGRSRHVGLVLQVAARQRLLTERYLNDVLLVRSGAQTDPAYTAGVLKQSARALLDGGAAPAVNGDDDDSTLPAASGALVLGQLMQGKRLVDDVTATGAALLAGRSVTDVHLTGGESFTVTNPLLRLRALAALSENVSLNSARSIAAASDANVSRLIRVLVLFGAGGALIALLLGWALISAARRQTAHFQSLVTSSTDLVMIFGDGGCRYVSDSVTAMLGRDASDLLGENLGQFIKVEDRVVVEGAHQTGKPAQITFCVNDKFEQSRHLEANVTDLRDDRRIRGVVLNARDVTERVALEEQLLRQAFHDALTGLPNRALFRDRLEQSLARCARSLDMFALLLIDLDGFKRINDTLGHHLGDQLLEAVARRLAEVARPTDTLARLGGDEFVLLLAGATEQTALAVASRLHGRLAEPIVMAGRDLAFGASIGIAVHRGGAGDGDELVRHADVAMYAAKEAGRGRTEVFHDDMDRALGELLGFEHELRLGLQREEFTVHYQPEVALDGTSVVGVEALLRWNSPTRGSVPPSMFIPAAEATGLIMPLGEFVVREACKQTARWRSDGVIKEPFNTWVNLSGKQLSAGGIDELILNTLEQAGLPARFLGLEITESVIVAEGTSGARAQNELGRLHEHGIRIAIDDFGTGFSALGQLRRFPIDVIKVDRSFVQGIENDPRDAAITANVVNLAHSLGILAIAEGIETDGQLASVRGYGCDHAQGYLFGRPLPAHEMDQVLAATRDGTPLVPAARPQLEADA
ncbi:MAG TPA: EAL domain-containing protein, partial [Solirubrobacteraceae bacterium]|nr:EAL domain-containing protein [Solirubrobacteraceae bacterium]